MSISYALVLACDLLPDGSDIGPTTIIRLERALRHWHETNEHLVVAASFSLEAKHAEQPTAMANMMADWLREHGCTDVVVLRALMFNTRGETDAFLKLENAKTIISAPWHLRRVKIQLMSDFGREFVRELNFVSADRHEMSRKEKFFLEPAKLTFELLTSKCSRPTRNRLWKKVRQTARLIGVNLSN